MVQVNIHEAKAKLSALARRVRAGETVILCDRNKPFAEIRPLPGVVGARRAVRRLGLMAGMCPVDPGFWEADAEIAADFEAGEIFPGSKG